MTAFDAQTVSLQGLNLIEASAGTGKTYTLAELYLRLVLEKDLTVDKILVVTYTRAATEELRDRLRQKLVDARGELLKNPADRKMLIHMVDPESVRSASQKLTLAIQSFDEAAIFTIHGFCQRVLGDFAFESGQRFDVEMIGDDYALLQSATDDFWRREITTADKNFVAYLLAKNESPETLLKSVRNLIAKPYIECLPVPEMDSELCYQQAQSQFEQLQNIWQKEQETVIATLNNKDLLNGNKYRTSSVEKWLLLLSNMLASPDMPLSLFEGFEKFTPEKLEDGLKKDKILPENPFWTACEQLLALSHHLQQARELQRQQLRLRLLENLRDTLPKQKQQQQLQSYDDLLLNLEQALSGERGDWLVARLRQQYQAALIDEFQDTDPVQYASFSRIYADSGLPTFLVGDPKQAIYSFRGADIFTYLQAKSRADIQHTLTTNWRSHPDLVSAVNTIFSRHAEPFIYKDIPFKTVDAARNNKPVLTVEQPDSVPLQILWAESDKSMAKKDLTAIAANVTADEIARLLNLAQSHQATLLDHDAQQHRAVSGGDIAVLVRNHKQAHEIQHCLQQRGINSVQQGRENVFASKEAHMLERILLAIAEPNNDARLKSALATQLWGLNAGDLYQLQQDENEWHAQLDVFYELHQLWLKHGFMRMFRQLLILVSAQQRLLTLADGDRQLTNILHLLELIQDQCSQKNDGMEAVLHWLSTHIQSADPSDETAQLRLESDEQLVKIITIHKSKGLEYPIVFCPFLWDVNLRSAKDPVISFHQQDNNNSACAAFSEPALSQAAELVATEERAEDLRLLYVALTRARERCVVIWGNVKGKAEGSHVSNSALFSLLHPTHNELDSVAMAADLSALAESSAGSVAVRTIKEGEFIRYHAGSDSTQPLSARPFSGIIQQPWSISSFSALTYGHDAELPDYDAQSLHETVIVQTAMSLALDRFSFPRGAQAGTCIHAMFEHWDFSSRDTEAMQSMVSRTLLQFGFDEKWTLVACQWLSEVVATRLEEGLSLNQLTPAQRLDEMAFYFPVANLSVDKLQRAMMPLLDKNSPLATVINRLTFSSLSGFMKGFIDLVFEHQGRFYIVDYKSNHLGNNELDYQASQLSDAMVAHDYPLQYLIYNLALHRYLRLRMPDYDPEQHLGGVYYLFVRGMKPDWDRQAFFMTNRRQPYWIV
ncbi:MAG: exodeoxyribonuclease V subunit beta [Gammaproteobacteria bacterium]|nr:exodeoxyribonuclease V subunit beta [Gammaproteobacteria bacterium]